MRVSLASNGHFVYNGALARLPKHGEKLSPLALYHTGVDVCPKDYHYHTVNSNLTMKDDENRLRGGPVAPGCWIQSFTKVGVNEKHFLLMEPDDKVELPLNEYQPLHLGGLVMDPPPPLLDQHFSRAETYHHYLVIASTVLASLATLEIACRYAYKLTAYRLIKRDEDSELELDETED